jgi:hypothetical protein
LALISPDVHGILYYASLAPSGHNTQPWSVRLGHDEMWVGTERARWLPRVDPTNREATLSLGAFLENMVVAAPTHGYVADYETIGPSTAAELIHRRLTRAARRQAPLEAIQARRTLRSGHQSREISSADVTALLMCGGSQHAHFFTAASKESRYLAEATFDANRLQICCRSLKTDQGIAVLLAEN